MSARRSHLDWLESESIHILRELIAHPNEEGRAAGINPLDHGDRETMIIRTDTLKAALDEGGYDIDFGGARRDEEKSRAKERVVSVRNEVHSWDPRLQRPELWQIYNTRLGKGQSVRMRSVRFRTLGCWPVTGAIASEAAHLAAVVLETIGARVSERQGRISDAEGGGSLEQKKCEGYV